ncbi:MAG: hypothetical protein H0U69_16015 [Trueperaceae bacterium]|nr:hypothetical protein [Trueperaceae bacterium]
MVTAFNALKPLAYRCRDVQGFPGVVEFEWNAHPHLLPPEFWHDWDWEDPQHPAHARMLSQEAWADCLAFRDELLSWAKTYRLCCPWILDMGGSWLGYLNNPWRLGRGGGITRREAPRRDEEITLTLPLRRRLTPTEWHRQAVQAATIKLKEHADAMQAELDRSGTPMKRLEKRRKANLVLAAQWQVSNLEWPDFIVTRELIEKNPADLRAAIKSILTEVGVEPRAIPS